MPKRSNAFQQAILILKKELAGASAIVLESAMLPHAITGEKREVDILIEKKIAGTKLLIAVECIDRKRKADSSWVEEMVGKHTDLPTNTLILASRNGFTAPAKAFATAKGIAVVNVESPSESLAHTIVGKLKEVFLKRGSSTVKTVEVTVFNEQEGRKEKFKSFADTDVLLSDGTAYGPMLDLVNVIRSMEQTSNAIFQNALPEHKNFQIIVPGPIIEGKTGLSLCVRSINPPTLREILCLTLIGHLTVSVHPISLDSAVVDHHPIAWGEVTIEGKKGTILINESESKIRFESTFSEKELRPPNLNSLGTGLTEATENAEQGFQRSGE